MMLLRMLRATEWGQLLDFVSPSLFAVLPPRNLARATTDLIASSRDSNGCRLLAKAAAAHLASRGLPLRLPADLSASPAPGRPPASEPERVARGQLVLRLYFEQLLGLDATLLDLRAARFAETRGGLVWSPSRGYARWDPAFLAGVRRMYRGFYADAPAEFQAGLEALGLQETGDLFRDHFGAGDQTAVRFEMAHFTESFHAVFVRCRERGARLHADFIPLGVYLAALYEHLETLAVPLDVRAAFAQAAA